MEETEPPRRFRLLSFSRSAGRFVNLWDRIWRSGDGVRPLHASGGTAIRRWTRQIRRQDRISRGAKELPKILAEAGKPD
jgi:hypothetical protein